MGRAEQVADTGSVTPITEGPSQQEIDQLLSAYNAGDLASAARLAETLKQKYPSHPFGWKALGAIYKRLGKLEASLEQMQQSVRLAPNDTEAHNNLGLTLKNLGRLKEAERHYREAIHLKHDFAEAHDNLGVLLKDLGRLKEAEASHREAIRLKPDLAGAHTNLGVTLKDLGRLNEAEASHREAIRLKPDLAESYSSLLFSLNYLESLTPEAALIEAKRYGAMVSTKAVPKFNSWLVDPKPTRLKIGLVSGDLRNHPVGYFIEGLIKHLDQDRFEIYAFPTTSITDDLTERIKTNLSAWIPIYGRADREAAAVIHAEGIHVLIDLSGHTAHNRLPVFSYKPVPVQATWLGYFATTGLPEMDYFLGDPTMSPHSEEHHFTEKVCNLAETWLCLTPPDKPVPISELPALSKRYVTFGCFGNLSKMNDQVVRTWARILRRIAKAKLVLKSRQLADPEVADEVKKRFAAEGILVDQLILEGPGSRAAYFDAYHRIDIVLDTFPYPGGTTSAEALWMGVPVLTLKGDRFLSRLGESISLNAGQTNWIAEDRDDYVSKAIAFAADIQGLANSRRNLREQVLQTPLFDTRRFAGNFGDALWGMWAERANALIQPQQAR